MSSILSRRRVRRRYYALALAVVLAGGAAILVIDRVRSRPLLAFSVESCVANADVCRNAGKVMVKGALAPRKLSSSKGCDGRFGLQSPGGVPPGTITVCADRVPSVEACRGEPGLEFYAAHGYLLLEVEGRFDGDILHADQVFVEAYDDLRYYIWRFGSPEEIESRSKRPAE
jgi:hypothetical protein